MKKIYPDAAAALDGLLHDGMFIAAWGQTLRTLIPRACLLPMPIPMTYGYFGNVGTALE